MWGLFWGDVVLRMLVVVAKRTLHIERIAVIHIASLLDGVLESVGPEHIDLLIPLWEKATHERGKQSPVGLDVDAEAEAQSEETVGIVLYSLARALTA